ncbi:MAG: hypothetical protein LBV36_08580 [Chromatiales bacterium]|jgi:hypothetical protein|nr:hypothetical protein [Chromatiales bacterium]
MSHQANLTQHLMMRVIPVPADRNNYIRSIPAECADLTITAISRKNFSKKKPKYLRFYALKKKFF